MHSLRLSRDLLRDRCQKAEVLLRGGEDLQQIAVHFSSDAKWLFICCGKCVQVCSRSSHNVIQTLRHKAPVTAALLNPKNHMQLLTSSLDGQLSLWDFMDNALLKTINFGVSLFKFGIRPGSHEPSIFFVIQKAEMSLVGLSSHVISERSPTVSPCDQLKDATQFFTTDKFPRDFRFTHKGTHLVTCSGNGKRLHIYDLKNEHQYSYKSTPYPITTLACHPSRLCIATGNRRGEIKLWYDFAKPDASVIVTTLHWHAHSVGDVCFTTDGSYLLSGGEEGVLVLWQLKTNHKQFRPRLGASISKVSCSPGDSYFAISLQSNVIQLVSGLSSEVEGTIGGFRKAMLSPGEHEMNTGLVLQPHSMSLVFNSTPGLLQFYNTESESLSSELNVVGLNHVSRVDTDPLIPTTIDHVAFSPAGNWMATVESRDDGKTSPELRMKFWEFVTTLQRYVQNTCVDPPHDKKVTSLMFQPASQRVDTHRYESPSTACNEEPMSPVLAVTTSLDERFKVWVLIDDREKEEEVGSKEAESKKEKGKRRKRTASWACRSVGYYHSLPCMGVSFSHDGSLLALNFKKNVTVWDPVLCRLRETFNSPHQDESFRQVEFGQYTCSQYLMASATRNLHVWDLLTCRLLWRVGVSVSYLVVDPFSFLVAAFVQSEEKGTILYLLEPSSPTPLAVHSSVCEKPVIGASFMPQTWDNKKLKTLEVGERSILYFMDKEQVLYSLGKKQEHSEKEPRLQKTDQKFDSHRAFSEIFGHRKRPNGLRVPTSSLSSQQVIPPTPSSSLFSAPPHVLPPPASICSHFIKRLLPLSKTMVDTSTLSEGNSDSSDETRGRADDFDEESPLRGPKKSCISSSPFPPNLNAPSGTVLESDDYTRERDYQTSLELKAGNYNWLIKYFKSEI